MLFYTLFEIVGYLISIVVMLVIIQFVLSLLIAFNVVNMHNQFVEAIWRAVNALLSGDSDFSPLVSKLKENNKRVIGCGVQSSTSDLLIATCDEFIYYDDLVRAAKKSRRAPKKKAKTKDAPAKGNQAAPEERQEAADAVEQEAVEPEVVEETRANLAAREEEDATLKEALARLEELG